MSSWRKPKPFKCPYCRKDFMKESQLKRHIKDAHPDKSKEEKIK